MFGAIGSTVKYGYVFCKRCPGLQPVLDGGVAYTNSGVNVEKVIRSRRSVVSGGS